MAIPAAYQLGPSIVFRPFQQGIVEVVFDPAFMSAMNRPWRDSAPSAPEMVAAGMDPPNQLIIP